MTKLREQSRQYWLWVTRPDYYLDEDGLERQDLDPSFDNDTQGWWTCHKDTRQGDLVFLWRTTPKRDIGYLIQVMSDAYSIADDIYAAKRGWDFGCDYEVLYKFQFPITIQDLHSDPYFQGWGTYRGQFRRRVSRIDPAHWAKLNQLAISKNPEYGRSVHRMQESVWRQRIQYEADLEEALVQQLALLRPFGYDLEIYNDRTTGRRGRQFVCRGHGGRIDLLCYDRKKRHYVVIELKNVRANQNTIGQVTSYMGWVQERVAGNVPVIGLVISREYDQRFKSSLRVLDRVFHINLNELGFD